MALPALRQELDLLPGPSLADGQPSHTLHDPVRNLYFQIDWPTHEVLCRWDMPDAQTIAAAVNDDTTLQLTAEDVEAVIRFLRDNQLLQPAEGSAPAMAQLLKKRRGTAGQWLLHNYLFFRLPLFRPDRLLQRWVGPLGVFFSRQFLVLTGLVLGLGVIEVYRDWDRFTSTLVDLFSWTGLLSYGCALIAVKVLHEFGHALMAKRFGCRVPTMGVAFLVLWPMAYTDTNEVWKLTSRRQRMLVAGAGIMTELAVAAWATLAWALLPDGWPKSIAFLLATTTWISSIAINASPFMRFDGYFLLADWLEMPNLHARAFALARWDLRERLFALGETVPEVFPRGRHLGLIAFAYATWIYRLVVFLGIAVLVYTFFIKAVGIFLFLVEIVWFILLPLSHELKAWQARWPVIRISPRARRSGLVAAASVLLFVLPWPTRVVTSGVLRPAQQFVVFAPPHSQVSALPVAEGGRVKAGDVLLQLASPDLQSREQTARAKSERKRWQAAAGAFDAEQRMQWQVAQEELTAANAELASLQADALRYTPRAPFDGVLRDLDPDLRPGVWVSQQEPLARLVADGELQVVAYLDEEDVARVATGDHARFYADALEGPFVPLQLVRVDPDASRTLSEPQLASVFGGEILTREKSGLLYPEMTAFRVTFRVSGSAGSLTGHAWRGKVVIAGRWSSPGARFARSALSLVWRETGF